MTETTAGSLAATIRSLKDRSGRSFEALARRVGVSRSALHRYTAGDAVPAHIEIIERLARECHATSEEWESLRRLWTLATRQAAAPSPPRTASAIDSWTSRSPAVPRELPADVAGFVGRAAALATLDQLIDPHLDSAGAQVVAIGAITGPPGVGKTALAVRWGHRATQVFPDGQIYVDLRGFANVPPMRPIEALTALLGSLGATPDQVPVDVAMAAARYRTLAAGRRLLIVLDNAGSASQVRPLLPGSPSCVVLVTSRDRLTGLVARDGAHRLSLDVLAVDESVELLHYALGRQRVAAELDQAAQLADLCAHLPIALRIAAARLADQPTRSIGDFVAELASAEDAVAAIDVAGDEEAALRAAFDRSYRALPESVRRLFRRLGLVACRDFTVGAVEALGAISAGEAQAVLDRLAAGHLLVQHSPGRFTLHDLLRQYAASLSATEDDDADRTATRGRLFDWYAAMAIASAEMIGSHLVRMPRPSDLAAVASAPASVPAAATWLEFERSNLVAVIRDAATRGPRRAAWVTADALRGYFEQGRHLTDWLTVARTAVFAARTEDEPLGLAAALHNLAQIRYRLGGYQTSTAYLRRTIQYATEAGWSFGEGAASHNLGILLQQQGRGDEATVMLQRSYDISLRSGRLTSQACAMVAMANVCRETGRLVEGVDLVLRAGSLLADHGAVRLIEVAGSTLGELYHLQGRLGDAFAALTEAATDHRRAGRRARLAAVLACLATVDTDAGRTNRAIDVGNIALAMADEIGEPLLQAGARNALAGAYLELGDHGASIELRGSALATAEAIGVWYVACEAQLGLAVALQAKQDHVAARDHAERSYAIATERGFAILAGRAAARLSDVFMDLGDVTRALRFADLARKSHEHTGHQLGLAATFVAAARIQDHVDGVGAGDRQRQAAIALYGACGAQPPQSLTRRWLATSTAAAVRDVDARR